MVGAQDCHPKASGAHTGDLSAEMLADAGARAIIVGHSERRADHGESDALVRQKAEAAWRAGVTAIVCIGETRGQRDAGQTLDICGGQLAGSLPDGATAANLVVAYEPVWAIGTGLTPTAKDVEEVHRFIRGVLTDRFGGGGRPDPNSLWRLGQALERRRIDGGRRSQRRPGWRRQPEGGRFPCYCGRLSLAKPRWYRGWQWPARSCNTAQLQENPQSPSCSRYGAAGL